MRSLLLALIVLLAAACGGNKTAELKELQRAKAGTLNVVLLSPGEALKQGKGSFVLEFRDAGGALVDVGTVKVGATMPMAGMAPMFGDCTVMPTPTKGRYDVSSDLTMAGTWRFAIAWDGPTGKGSASIPAAAL